MHQIFTVKGFTLRFKRGGDEKIVEVETVAGLQVETTLVKCSGRVDPPKWYQRVVQYLSGFSGVALSFRVITLIVS